MAARVLIEQEADWTDGKTSGEENTWRFRPKPRIQILVYIYNYIGQVFWLSSQDISGMQQQKHLKWVETTRCEAKQIGSPSLCLLPSWGLWRPAAGHLTSHLSKEDGFYHFMHDIMWYLIISMSHRYNINTVSHYVSLYPIFLADLHWTIGLYLPPTFSQWQIIACTNWSERQGFIGRASQRQVAMRWPWSACFFLAQIDLT